ncbi:DUF4232 domain-containing protein [Streptomyces iconiensis]|uniref:DUF4232 domain-containing protein n=1 Tax=Streptomyces iconiensis TaxID=1384038 RepID=A0ABT6ZRP8_9ACTN|nr:DUF4232 domain-containing protein [Streptomyces iconiensis]MDJ1131188.1 DUF4232 domain-containing protein [Streptomyces iconiensis]
MTQHQDTATVRTRGQPGGPATEADSGSTEAGSGSVRGRGGVRVRLVAATAVLAASVLLAGCGEQGAGASGPVRVDGSAAPAGGDGPGGKSASPGGRKAGSASPSLASDSPAGNGDGGKARGGNGDSGDSARSGEADGAGTRPPGPKGGAGDGDQAGQDGACRTGELSASVGTRRSGAGQQNVPLVLTNDSSRTCTVGGYPGMAFVDGAGNQVAPDPERAPGETKSVTLSPGSSAWAPLSYTNPAMTGAPTVTPVALSVTPPDQSDSLRADWPGAQVAESGEASTPRIGPLSPGTGP